MTSTRPESRVSSTLIQLTTLVTVVFGGGWFARGVQSEMKDMRTEVSATKAEVVAVNAKLDREFVTWTQARIYAADFRAANTKIDVFVPDISQYKDLNRTN